MAAHLGSWRIAPSRSLDGLSTLGLLSRRKRLPLCTLIGIRRVQDLAPRGFEGACRHGGWDSSPEPFVHLRQRLVWSQVRVDLARVIRRRRQQPLGQNRVVRYEIVVLDDGDRRGDDCESILGPC